MDKCEKELCTEIATGCAVLTDGEGNVKAHLRVCDEHAREMFAINIDRETHSGFAKSISPLHSQYMDALEDQDR
jgi:hypothetical protein